MRDPAEPVRYASVNAAVDDLRTMLPAMRMIVREMELQGHDVDDPDDYARAKDVLAMLEDRSEMKHLMERLKRPDGTVVFEFSPEAAAILRELHK